MHGENTAKNHMKYCPFTKISHFLLRKMVIRDFLPVVDMPLRKSVISDFKPEIEILPFCRMCNEKWSKMPENISVNKLSTAFILGNCCH